MEREMGDGRAWPSSDDIVSLVGEGTYRLDPTGRFAAVNDALLEATGYEREDVLGEHVTLLVAEGDVSRVEDEIRSLLADDSDGVASMELPVRTADGETFLCELRFTVLVSDGRFEGTVGIARDISDRKRRDATLRAQRDELERLRRINAVIRSIDRAVVRAETTEEIEQAVCDRIARADPYLFAAIGRVDSRYETFRPRVWAGIESEYADTLVRSNLAPSDGPSVQAARTRSVQVVQDTEEGEYPWSDRVTERGFMSFASVPLVREETVYGVLMVYADRPYAFDERERSVLAELGQMVGHAIAAVRSRQALVAERVVELEFRFADEEHLFTALSAEAGCTVRLEDAIRNDDRELLLYLSVDGCDPASVVEIGRSFPGVTHLRPIDERDDGCSLEIRYEDMAAFSALADHGGVVRSAISENGENRIRVHLPETADVRETVDALASLFDEVELVSRRMVERPSETRGNFRDAVRDSLTDRQRTVLTTAYRAGYFRWPRESTGEEVADSLGISPPTLHKHLRLAEEKVLSAFFDGSEG